MQDYVYDHAAEVGYRTLFCFMHLKLKSVPLGKNPLLSILIFKVVLMKILKKQLKLESYIQIKDIILRIQKPTKVVMNVSLFF